MTVPLVLVSYAGLAGILPAAGHVWLAVPLCLLALAAVGELWLRALPGAGSRSAIDCLEESGVPAARIGFAALAGLITLPLVALALHAVGAPVRPVPLVIGGAVTATLLGAVAFLRERLATRDPKRAPGNLPAQRTPVPPNSAEAASQPDPASPGSLSPGASPGSLSLGETPAGAVLPAASSSRRGWASAGSRTGAAVAVPLVLALVIGGFAVRTYLSAPRPAQPGYLSVALHGWAAKIDGPVTVPARGLTVPVRVHSSGLDTLTTLLSLKVGGRVVTSRPLTVAANTERAMTVRLPALPPDGCLRAVNVSVGRTSTVFYARGERTAAGATNGRPARTGRTRPAAASTRPDAASAQRGAASAQRGAASAQAGGGAAEAVVRGAAC